MRTVPPRSLTTLPGLNVTRMPDGMWNVQWELNAERGAVLMKMLDKIEAELPRLPGTTEEQHRADAFVDIFRRDLARSDRESAAVATIREADERARRALGGGSNPRYR